MHRLYNEGLERSSEVSHDVLCLHVKVKLYNNNIPFYHYPSVYRASLVNLKLFIWNT